MPESAQNTDIRIEVLITLICSSFIPSFNLTELNSLSSSHYCHKHAIFYQLRKASMRLKYIKILGKLCVFFKNFFTIC